MLETSIKTLIQCSCVSEDRKLVLPLLQFAPILCTAILNNFFFNLSRDSLTNIDWLLQSHGSIGHIHWFITPTPPLPSKLASEKIATSKSGSLMGAKA